MPCGPAGFLMKINLLILYIDIFRALLSQHEMALGGVHAQ